MRSMGPGPSSVLGESEVVFIAVTQVDSMIPKQEHSMRPNR
ncbi:protein of unknown function [Pararobbsia alpina]